MTGRELLSKAIQSLELAGVEDAPGDARKLLQRAFGASQFVLIDLGEVVRAETIRSFEADIVRRASRVPMSHIFGSREFYGREFEVSADVLDPRPDTETLIDVALETEFTQVLDLGTGSGCILATLLCEVGDATGLGTDLSNGALQVAHRNIETLGLDGRTNLKNGSWYDPVVGDFDLIVSNPPYIAENEMADLQPEVRLHEPHMALTDGDDGLQCYREIVGGHDPYLRKGGRLIVEIGPNQAKAVSDMMSLAGLLDIRVVKDLDGRDRVVLGHKPLDK